MQRRKFLRTTVALSAFAPILACTKPKTGDSTDPFVAGIIADIEAIVPDLLKANNVPSFSIALINEGKRIYSKGFGTTSIASGKPVDGDTVFECASISKTVFAYAIMQLCKKGTLELDKPLASYGVAIETNDPRAALVTARHILSHQSGLQDWRTSEEPLKFHFDPGKGFLYSGEGYYYLQSVVTHLLGKKDPGKCGEFEAGLKVCATDIGEFLEQQVLQPLAMKSSGYISRDSMRNNYALPHNEQGVFSKPPQGPVELARYASAGGLLTTANDYATFITQLFEPVEKDPYRLDKASLDTMFTPQVKMPPDVNIDGATSWALGWAIQERPGGNVIVHSGGQPGYRSLAMTSIDKRSGFVMLTNSDRGGYILYNEGLAKVVNRLLPEV